MYNLTLRFGLFVTILSLFSCSNDFQLTEGEVNIPVVYGFLTPESEFTYIRVEKAFIDESVSGTVLAADPDNLYYNDITVSISHVSNPDKLPVSLVRIDGNLEGLVREEGIFANAPNYLYKVATADLNLIPGDEYKITIRDGSDNILTEASTFCLTPYNDESLTTPSMNSDLSFNPIGTTSFRWLTDRNAAMHNLQIVFFYDEIREGVSAKKELIWNLGRNIVSDDNRAAYSIRGNEFYSFMANSLDKDPSVRRFFDRATINITSGGREVREYLTVANANLGITSSGEIPTYSNLSNGALGIFSSRTHFTRENIRLARLTLDSLRNGSVTKELNFQ